VVAGTEVNIALHCTVSHLEHVVAAAKMNVAGDRGSSDAGRHLRLLDSHAGCVAERSIATLRPEAASAPVAEMVPLFSTRFSPPLRSTMPAADPFAPEAVALIVPALRIVPTAAS